MQMASLESWSVIMYQTAAAVGVGDNLVPDSNLAMECFCIVFVVVGSFLMLNLVAGVAIDKFKQVPTRLQSCPGRANLGLCHTC